MNNCCKEEYFGCSQKNKCRSHRKDLRREIFGCSCSGMNHAVQFMHFPPKPGEPDPETDNTIYLTGTFQQWRDMWKPGWMNYISDIFTKDYWKDFWHGTVWSRLPIAFRYMHKNKPVNYSILDAMNFQERDFDRLYFFLDQISDGYDIINNIDEVIWLEDHRERWMLRIEIDDTFKDRDWLPEIGIDIQFKNRKTLGRIWHGLKYIFNCNGCDEIGVTINEKNSKKLKGMIIYLQKLEKEIEERRKKKEDEKTGSSTG